MTTYQSSEDKQIRGNAVAHLRALKVDEDITHIQEAVTAYGNKTGVLPPSMNALIIRGLSAGQLIATFILASVFAGRAALADTLAITHVNIIDTNGAVTQPDMTLVVQEGRIAGCHSQHHQRWASCQRRIPS